MPAVLGTDVAIHLRDGDPWVISQTRGIEPPPFLSAATRVELENGVWREPEWSNLRRRALDAMLTFLLTLDFGASEIAAYRTIVESAGFSRRKTADRMTAATALAQQLPLVTLNGRDFQDVPGLELVAWERPR